MSDVQHSDSYRINVSNQGNNTIITSQHVGMTRQINKEGNEQINMTILQHRLVLPGKLNLSPSQTNKLNTIAKELSTIMAKYSPSPELKAFISLTSLPASPGLAMITFGMPMKYIKDQQQGGQTQVQRKEAELPKFKSNRPVPTARKPAEDPFTSTQSSTSDEGPRTTRSTSHAGPQRTSSDTKTKRPPPSTSNSSQTKSTHTQKTHRPAPPKGPQQTETEKADSFIRTKYSLNAGVKVNQLAQDISTPGSSGEKRKLLFKFHPDAFERNKAELAEKYGIHSAKEAEQVFTWAKTADSPSDKHNAADKRFTDLLAKSAPPQKPAASQPKPADSTSATPKEAAAQHKPGAKEAPTQSKTENPSAAPKEAAAQPKPAASAPAKEAPAQPKTETPAAPKETAAPPKPAAKEAPPKAPAQQPKAETPPPALKAPPPPQASPTQSTSSSTTAS